MRIARGLQCLDVANKEVIEHVKCHYLKAKRGILVARLKSLFPFVFR